MTGTSKKDVRQSRRLTGLYLYNIGANLVGFATIVVLNLSTPIAFFKINRTLLLAGGWHGLFLALYPLLVAVICGLQYRIQRPITRVLALSNSSEPVSGLTERRAKRRLLNLPFLIGFLNLMTYVIVSLMVSATFFLLRDVPLSTCLFLLFRATMIGLIATGLSFFLVEAYCRERLIPRFFPDGKLFDVPGTIRISILRKIRLLNMAGTLNPMLLLLVTLLFVLWQAQNAAITSEQLGRELFLFAVVLCVVFATIALRLNALVGDSILKPIGEMLDVVNRVKGGDFEQRIKVLSNDELGILANAGNDMIQGLAEREKIKDTFGKYVTPEIRDEILTGRIPLDGIRAEATLLFSDLRAFTHYVEENDPEEVIESMRAYFTAMEQAVRVHRGLVLQYVGDEIEAVFGVPVSDRLHADNAVRAALEMRNRLNSLNQHRQHQGKPGFSHGIGICTGPVLAGNTGSDNHLSYALIGDTVNLASRIQDLTKQFHCDILVSEETVNRLDQTFHIEKMPPQSVKGYSKPLTLYRL